MLTATAREDVRAGPAVFLRHRHSRRIAVGIFSINYCANGCIRSLEDAYSKDGGLAVLYGILQKTAASLKPRASTHSILKFTGPAKVYESQDHAVEAIPRWQSRRGDVVVIRVRGREAGPGMRKRLTQRAS
ncbi:dihydroxy-acid dehydratase [Escherichia coli]